MDSVNDMLKKCKLEMVANLMLAKVWERLCYFLILISAKRDIHFCTYYHEYMCNLFVKYQIM